MQEGRRACVELRQCAGNKILHMLPRLTQARVALTKDVVAVDERGGRATIAIPAERSLSVYVNREELVTLMTLGVNPELLVLGYLLNQRLIADASALESITVDWDALDCPALTTQEGHAEGMAGVAAVRSHGPLPGMQTRAQTQTITTGCGQGSVFGKLLDGFVGCVVAQAYISQTALFAVIEHMRLLDTTYRVAGSVHGCALFAVQGEQVRCVQHVEDVGRHNALDTIAGWQAMQPRAQPGATAQQQARGVALLYTTGRLTSEMLIKAAQMGIPFVVSRSGITHMGYLMARRIGICAIGRALHRRYQCYSEPQRIVRAVA